MIRDQVMLTCSSRFTGPISFLEVDRSVTYEMVERVARSWDMAPSTTPNAQLVTEEQVVIAEVMLCIQFVNFGLLQVFA